MSVILTNRAGRFQTFVLTHEDYCAARGACACTLSSERAPRRIPKALLLPSGGVSPSLEDAVLAVPEIARAVRSGAVTVERAVAAPRAATTAPAPPPTDAPVRDGAKKKRGGG